MFVIRNASDLDFNDVNYFIISVKILTLIRNLRTFVGHNYLIITPQRTVRSQF